MSPDPLKLNIAKYGDKYHKNFPDIETFNYFCSMDRNIQYYKNYFIDFYNALDSATQKDSVPGTPEREAFNRDAENYCIGQIILEAHFFFGFSHL